MRAIWMTSFVLAALASPVFAQGTPNVQFQMLPFDLKQENPAEIEATPDSITLIAPKGSDIFTPTDGGAPVNTASRLTFAPARDFIFSARLDVPFAADYDGAALVIYGDSTHWGKLLYERINDKENAVTSSVVSPVSDNSYHVRTAAADQTVWLKVVRAGHMVLFYMSQDGAHWDILRDLSFESPTPVTIGFLSQSPLGEQLSAKFSDIHYEAKTFKDYWQGE